MSGEAANVARAAEVAHHLAKKIDGMLVKSQVTVNTRDVNLVLWDRDRLLAERERLLAIEEAAKAVHDYAAGHAKPYYVYEVPETALAALREALEQP